MSVAVVKTGVGNTASVMFALERLGAKAVLTDEPRIIEAADRIVLPGVGAAAHAMSLVRERDLFELLRAFERPLLGICLGQQLLFDASEEGDVDCLGLVEGRVRRFVESTAAPSPHMGWARLSLDSDDPLTEGIEDGAYAYFVHSYFCPVTEATLARATHGVEFAAMVRAGNRWGCQFHPERSGDVGARILENFLRAPC